MWPFNKKTSIATSGILSGATDHHSHILPGVDDGVETLDEALRILSEYERLGVKAIWLTPHIMEDVPNTPEKLSARFNELKAAYTGNITLHLAAEYMIDNNLHKLIQEINSPSLPRGTTRGSVVCDDGYFSTPKECPIGATQVEGVTFLPIGAKGNHLLVETSYFTPPMRMHETLRKIKSCGYHPLLAHPERYMYMKNDEYRQLREEGIKFQLNLVSLAGGYGRTVKKKAEWLLENRLYSVCGSDLHSEEAIEYITGCKLTKKEMIAIQRLLSATL